MQSGRARHYIGKLGLTFAALAFVCAQTAPAAAFSFGKKHKAPEVVAAPPPPPPPEPEIAVGPPALAGYVITTAGAYAAYMQSAAGIGNRFTNGGSVIDALRLGVHSEQHQMQQGVVAYAAIVALQDPDFVAGVRGFASHASTRDAMVRYILADPNYVMTLPGHDSAAGLIVATLNGQGARLQAAGELVQQASLDIQLKAAWSKKAAPNQAGTLEEVKHLSATTLDPPEDVKARLTQASTGAAPLGLAGGMAAQQPYSQTVARGMAIAALAILGKAGDQDMPYVMALLVNDGDGFCFNMSKLNLYQCLSVARPHYENMYCLGLHAMADTGRCVRAAVGESAPFTPGDPGLVPAATPVASAAGRIGESAALTTQPLRQ